MTLAMKPPTPATPLRRPPPRPGLLARLLFAIPIFGAMLREVAEDRAGSLGWFAFSLFGGVAALGLAFGLPGLTIGMLVAAFTMFVLIVTIARG